MKPNEEDQLVADLILDLKGAKNKRENWIEIAKKCRKAANHFGSTKNAALKIGVSYSLLRSIISLLKLPVEIQELVRKRHILYDAAQRLLTLPDSRQQIEVARAIVGLPSHKQREIIQYAKGHPTDGLPKVIERVRTRPKQETERIHVAVVPLREDAYSSLSSHAMNRKVSVEKLILDIIHEWIAGRNSQT